MDFKYFIISKRVKYLMTDYEILDTNENVIYRGKGNLSGLTKVLDLNNNEAFRIKRKGIISRSFLLLQRDKIITELSTKSLFWKKEFEFDYPDGPVTVKAKGYWEEFTFFHLGNEVAKVHRTKKSAFSSDKFSLAVDSKYEASIFMGIVIILNRIKTQSEG